jgi:FkbM family methyltransferase
MTKTAFNQFLSTVKNYAYPNRIRRRSPPKFYALNGVSLRAEHRQIKGEVLEEILGGYYEGEEAACCLALLRKDDIVLEVGSGLGYLSTLIGKTGLARKIYAVEADPSLIPIIQDTHRINRITAEIHHGVFGGTQGPRQFYIADLFWANSVDGVQGVQKIVTVQGLPWSKSLVEWRPSLVVMDIEGGEAELIPLGFPQSVRRLVIEFHPAVYGKEKQDELLSRLEAIGFAVAVQKGQVYALDRD